MTTLQPLPPTFAATREGLHAIAEHVLAPLRYHEDGHIGLRPTPHGFGTPMLAGEHQAMVADGLMVVQIRGHEEEDDITTIAEAANFVKVVPGAIHDVYTPATDGDIHRPLGVDRAAARVLGEWFTFGAMVLTQVRNRATMEEKPSLMQLWPEHFDLAFDLGPEGKRANVGASPGDAEHPEPYLYVGPWGEKPADPIWNEPFGASLAYADLLASADPVADGVAWVGKVRAVLAG